ncbi:MAG: G-D-S-L family lipolytic protein [Nostocales cyanobacterium]|nr:MAG: G-D-S-L family lipolytic protein [Nostocales cyanobacterium]TAF19659.1 MAG: G-D-S-L family lipolytic protein [Nostocales cyanobacterium]
MTAKKTILLILFLIVGFLFINHLYQIVFKKPVFARIIFFGDSITQAGVKRNGYVTIVANTLKQEYPNHNLEVIGAGISGNKVTDLQARLQKDVLAKNPTHVVIYIGINDVWHFYAFDNVTGTDAKVFEQGLRDMIQQIRDSGAEVSLCTPSVIGEKPDSKAEVNQLLKKYADISRNVAKTSGVHLCDLRIAFEEYLRTNNKKMSYQGILTSDGVHLNDQGNRFVADVILKHLRPLLTEREKLEQQKNLEDSGI